MQTHISESPKNRTYCVATADRPSQDRQLGSLPSRRAIIVLGAGMISRAELISESPSQIEIRVAAVDRSTLVGDKIEVLYRGHRCGGEIQFITQQGDGCHIGLRCETPDAK